MSDAIIFIFGLLVTGMTAFAVILVGLSEAGDEDLDRNKDLTQIEKKLVGDKRDDADST